MSRAMNVRLPLSDVETKCAAAKVRISAIEPLPSGHTHVVLTTSEGAETMRKKFGDTIITAKEKRFPFVTVRHSRS